MTVKAIDTNSPIAAQDHGLGDSITSHCTAFCSIPGANHSGSMALLKTKIKVRPPEISPAKAPALVTPDHTEPKISGPANAAIMQPLPTQTMIVTFISNIFHARIVHKIIITTVLTRLTFNTLRSTSSSLRLARNLGTKLKR